MDVLPAPRTAVSTAATIAAILRYLDQQGIKPSGDVHITDDLIAELSKQTARVCPLVCPPGEVADRDQCVDATRGKPIVRPGKESPPPKRGGGGNQAGRPTQQPTQQPNPQPARTAEPKPSGGARIGVTPGVGF